MTTDYNQATHPFQLSSKVKLSLRFQGQTSYSCRTRAYQIIQDCPGRFKNAYQDAIASIRVNRVIRHLALSKVQHSLFKHKSSEFSNSNLKSQNHLVGHNIITVWRVLMMKEFQQMQEMPKLAGLGEKKVQIPDVDCTTEEFHEALAK